MKSYQIEMRRTYSTNFEVQATDLQEAMKEFEKLGDSIYSVELEQCCVIDSEFSVTDDNANTYVVGQEPRQRFTPIKRYQKPNNEYDLIKAIQNDTEYLSTTEGDEIECIGIELLEGILSRYFNTTIKITQ